MNIATLTLNPCVDTSCRAEKVSSNRKLRCSSPRFDPGGGGINVSVVLQELGGDSTAVFSCAGPAGKQLVQLLQKKGIRSRPVEIKNPTRNNLSVRDESTGEQFRFVMPGPELSPEEINACLSTLNSIQPPPDILVVSGSMPPGVPPGFMKRLAEHAKERDIRLVVDASGEALKKAAEAGIFLLKPNRRELEALTGMKINSAEKRDQALSRLIETTDCENIVLSLGGDGACLASRDGVKYLKSPDVDVKSRTGAGDSMVGGIVTGLCREYSLRDAVRLGIAAGSAAVMTGGTELCHRKDVETLFEKIG